jgi:hypothetical protein
MNAREGGGGGKKGWLLKGGSYKILMKKKEPVDHPSHWYVCLSKGCVYGLKSRMSLEDDLFHAV